MGLRSSDDFRGKLIERRVERWQDRMRQSHEWISFTEIAEWCAREKGSIRADDQLREEAYCALGKSVTSGEFEVGGRSRVVYPDAMCLASYPVRIRVTREMYEAFPSPKRDALGYFWIPRDLCQRWFETRRLPLPPWLSADRAARGTESEKAQSAGPNLPATAPTKRKHNGHDYRPKDASLVAKMAKLIAAGEARSPEHAARAFVNDAEGYGTPASKVKRLTKHYRETHRTQS